MNKFWVVTGVLINFIVVITAQPICRSIIRLYTLNTFNLRQSNIFKLKKCGKCHDRKKELCKNTLERLWKMELKDKFILWQTFLNPCVVFFIIHIFHELFEDPL